MNRDLALRRSAGLGDVLMAVAAARAVRHAYPNIRVGVETLPQYTPLLQACLDLDWDLRPTGVRVDLDSPMHGLAREHQINSYLRRLGIDPDSIPDSIKVPRIQFPRPAKRRNLIGLHVAAVDANRFYPHWVRVARGLMELGYEIRVIGPDTTYLESLSLIEECAVFASTDSGPIQLAGATSTPTVGLYSVTRAEWRKPFGSSFRAIEANCPSFPCYQELIPAWPSCGLPRIERGESAAKIFGDWCPQGGYACMTSITPEQVIATILELANANLS